MLRFWSVAITTMLVVLSLILACSDQDDQGDTVLGGGDEQATGFTGYWAEVGPNPLGSVFMFDADSTYFFANGGFAAWESPRLTSWGNYSVENDSITLEMDEFVVSDIALLSDNDSSLTISSGTAAHMFRRARPGASARSGVVGRYGATFTVRNPGTFAFSVDTVFLDTIEIAEVGNYLEVSFSVPEIGGMTSAPLYQFQLPGTSADSTIYLVQDRLENVPGVIGPQVGLLMGQFMPNGITGTLKFVRFRGTTESFAVEINGVRLSGN